MKKYFFSIMILALMTGFTACNKWEEPEFTTPKYTGPEANRTIQDIIAVYTAAGHMDSICHGDEEFIVRATVVSSDEGGNFYKNMVVEDETGAIQLQINTSGLCHTYPPGQTVYINCKGLVVGNYHGVYQIGWIYNGEVGRIDGHFLDQYLTKDGLPQTLVPTDINTVSDINDGNVCRLVRIHNCEFADDVVGKPWSEETSTTSRTIKSINGQAVSNLVVRTSNYAKFRKAYVPGGTGDLVGILSVYNSTYQLMLRTIDDVLDFGTLQEIYSVNIDESNSTFNGAWFAYQGYYAHSACTTATDDWLVSPSIPAATINGSTLYIDQRIMDADANVPNTFMIYYTTNYTGDATTTEWTQLPYTIESNNFYMAETEVLNNLSGNVRVAFRYKTTGSYNGSWAVRGLHFKKIVTR